MPHTTGIASGASVLEAAEAVSSIHPASLCDLPRGFAMLSDGTELLFYLLLLELGMSPFLLQVPVERWFLFSFHVVLEPPELLCFKSAEQERFSANSPSPESGLGWPV